MTGYLSFPSSGWGTAVGAKLQLRLMVRGAHPAIHRRGRRCHPSGSPDFLLKGLDSFEIDDKE
jgi:hypothetical protein